MFGASHAAVLAMHIPDNCISPSTSALFWAVMIPVWALCLRSVIRRSTAENMAYLGAGAAFSFLIMMFNVPTPGGTTVHGVGGALIALLLGPQYATVAISVALLLQALLFGDGGLLTLGANCFNRAFVLPFCAYGIFMLLRKVLRAKWKDRVAEFVSAYVGIVLAAPAAISAPSSGTRAGRRRSRIGCCTCDPLRRFAPALPRGEPLASYPSTKKLQGKAACSAFRSDL